MLGYDLHGKPFDISLDTFRRHIYCAGSSGTGKTNLMHNLMVEEFAGNFGFCFIDPHGDEAEKLADTVPNSILERVIYLDPSDLSHCVGYNVLENVQESERPLAAEHVLSAFAHVWGLSAQYTPRLLHILRNSLRLLLDTKGTTLLGLAKLLVDDHYRKVLLGNCLDPTVRMFWEEEFAQWNDRQRTEYVASLQNKIGAFVSNPAVRNIIGQRSTINPATIMARGLIFICNLSKGKLGEETSSLLGALLVTGFAQAAEGRASIPEEKRVDFRLYVDEFQNFATTTFANILSEARKYRLSVVLAHQYLSQLPEPLRDAVLGAASTYIVFRVGANDAPLLASQLGLGNPAALKDLPNFHAWVKTIEDGTPGTPVRIETLAPAPTLSHFNAVRARTRARYARPRAKVEAEINRFLEA